MGASGHDPRGLNSIERFGVPILEGTFEQTPFLELLQGLSEETATVLLYNGHTGLALQVEEGVLVYVSHQDRSCDPATAKELLLEMAHSKTGTFRVFARTIPIKGVIHSLNWPLVRLVLWMRIVLDRRDRFSVKL
ncbi:MAG TPA: hypothetical protein VFS50_04010 [Meiothermus sp.]|jgi:hypothetical protein|nr:hypothetical protein [Meiothermus sp.]